MSRCRISAVELTFSLPKVPSARKREDKEELGALLSLNEILPHQMQFKVCSVRTVKVVTRRLCVCVRVCV